MGLKEGEKCFLYSENGSIFILNNYKKKNFQIEKGSKFCTVS